MQLPPEHGQFHDASERDKLLELTQGSEEAFVWLYLRYKPVLTKILQPYSRHIEIAEMVQEIFYRIWLKKEMLGVIQSFQAYVIRMARNRVLDAIRASKVRDDYNSQMTAIVSATTHEDAVLYNELSQQAASAIQALPERQRKVFTMNVLQDIVREDIAGRLGVSVYTVDKDLAVAVRTIKAAIGTN